MDSDDKLGPGGINWLASIVADGTATPEDARRLLMEFVRQADIGDIHPLLIAHLRTCIGAYLNGRKVLDPAPEHGRDKPVGVPIPSMEKAFGLTRVTPGGPRTDADTFAEAAMEVLERRLAGESFQEAAANVAEDRKARQLPVSSDSQVRSAWSRHQADGYLMLRLAKANGVEASPPWTAAEIDRLTDIFKGKTWFSPPHVDAKARLDAILAEVDRPGTDNSDVKERVAAVLANFDGRPVPKNSRNK